MLTKITVRNFKGIHDCELTLDKAVVFVGPNNSGKTTALQAISLWEIGLHTLLAKCSESLCTKNQNAVAINRRDLISIPVADAKFLWKQQKVCSEKNDAPRKTKTKSKSKNETKNICIHITVEGIFDGQPWCVGFEFDYANSESFYCRPDFDTKNALINLSQRLGKHLNNIRIVFLPPMSGLASVERKLEQGSIDVLIGEGQTAQVLRNLCLLLYQSQEKQELWNELIQKMKHLFGVTIFPPQYDPARGEISMFYQDLQNLENGSDKLELSSSGRGLQQTLLILAFLYLHPGTVILLDEPDAHLEILRQKQIYENIKIVAQKQHGQIIVATHSEAILNESAEKDTVIAFLGKPHQLNNHKQLVKSLAQYGWEHCYLAQQKGWVLYLEGSTDLDILRQFARLLNHPVQEDLESPFYHTIGSNLPKLAENHFYALCEAKPDLRGYALFDRISSSKIKNTTNLKERYLKRREIENYFCTENVLIRWAKEGSNHTNANRIWTYANPEDYDGFEECEDRFLTMKKVIEDVENSLRTLKKADSLWSPDLKASEDVLRPILENYFERLGSRYNVEHNVVQKSRFHELIPFMEPDEVDAEIKEILDEIHGLGCRG